LINQVGFCKSDETLLQVPIGTFFKDTSEEIVADLKKDGDLFVAARGGAGGHGNHYFLSNEERAPTVYEEGAQGQERLLFSEMRVMAHVGLVRCLLVFLLM